MIVNLRGIPLLVRGEMDFPAPPPGGAWSNDVVSFLAGMAVADTINAAVSVVYAVAHFRKHPWRHWLGTLTLAIALYAAAVFGWATMSVGAWTAHPVTYLAINVTFVPAVALFVLVGSWSVGRATSP